MLSKKSGRTDRGHSFPAKPDHPLIARAPLWAALLVTAAFVSGCVVHSHGRGHGRGVVVEPLVDVGISVPEPVTFVFTDHHRHAVHDYYRHHPQPHWKKSKEKPEHWIRTGKGKWKKHGHRPPGMHRHDVLPPGIAMQALPHRLARQLPHPPHDTQYIFYNDQVLLVDVHSHVVLDFIDIRVGF